MTPAVTHILPEPGTFSGHEKTPSGQPGQGDEFQNLVTRALWHSLQPTDGHQTKSGEATATKPGGKIPDKSSSKKSDVSAEKILTNPSLLAEMSAFVENSKILPVIVPPLPVSPSATVTKDLSTNAAKETGGRPATQISPPQINALAANAKQIVPASVAKPEISTGAIPVELTAEKIQTLAEAVSALPDEIKNVKNPVAEKGSPPPLPAMDAAPKNILSGRIEIPMAAEPKVQAAIQASPEIHGTVVAQQDVQMKKSENATEIAGQSGPDEKVLPTKTSSVPVEKDLPVEFSVPVHPGKLARVFAEKIPSPLPAPSGVAAAHAVSASSPADDKLSIENPVSTSAAADVNVRTIERTHHLMALQAIQLRDSNAASLRVVIKPDTGMQLSLELRQRGDGVDARAILQQGDFNQWSQQWPELQQRLEQRGIKLAPLADQNFLNNENHSFQQGQQSAKKDLPDSLPADFSIVKPKNAARSSRMAATTNRLESWA